MKDVDHYDGLYPPLLFHLQRYKESKYTSTGKHRHPKHRYLSWLVPDFYKVFILSTDVDKTRTCMKKRTVIRDLSYG